MNIRELYENLQESPDVVILRFCGNAKLLERFVKRFPEDPTYQLLEESIKLKNYEEVERMAHTLKGVAMNLGFSVLGDASAELVTAIRRLETDSCERHLGKIRQEYEKVLDLISKLED